MTPVEFVVSGVGDVSVVGVGVTVDITSVVGLEVGEGEFVVGVDEEVVTSEVEGVGVGEEVVTEVVASLDEGVGEDVAEVGEGEEEEGVGEDDEGVGEEDVVVVEGVGEAELIVLQSS